MTFVKGQSGNPQGLTRSALAKLAARSVEKQAKMVDCLSRGMTLEQIAKECGYASKQSVWNAVKRLKASTPEILNLMNLPLPRALRKLGDELEAKETKFIVCDKQIHERTVEAHEVQQNAAVQLARLHDAYPREAKSGTNSAPVAVNIHIDHITGRENPKRPQSLLDITAQASAV